MDPSKKTDVNVTLFGLGSCDTCRKAAKQLSAAGYSLVRVDVRADPLDPRQIARFLDAFGDALINRKSTTWRGLSEAERAGAPADLLAAHPALMKRPVVDGPGGLTLGADAQAAHLG
ncbi:MAG: arsenate reductase [Rhodobacteraceae bacterium]|nr:arsenate reductase [Paracoccaceae bacterium]